MPDHRYSHADYLKDVLEPALASRLVSRTCKVIRRICPDVGAIAFSGMSGALIAPIVALRLKKPLIMVRKDNDGSHSSLAVEGVVGSDTYIILDDQISTGATVRRIKKHIKKFDPDTKYLGTLCYSDYGDWQTRFSWPKMQLTKITLTR